MFNNYLLLSIRHLLKQKIQSLLMILGLAVGFAASGIILIINYHEASYDKHWQDADLIYQLEADIAMSGGVKYSSTGAPDSIYHALSDHLAGISHVSRKKEKDTLIKTVSASTPATFQERASLIDTDFFAIFPPKILQGNLASFYNDEYSVVISEGLAFKLFSDQPAVGKIISLDITNFDNISIKAGDNARQRLLRDFKIAAVIKFPEQRHSIGPLQLFVHIHDTPPPKDSFGFFSSPTYLKLTDRKAVPQIEKNLPALLDNTEPVPDFIKQKPSEMFGISLLNIKQAHASFKQQQHQQDNSGILYGLAAIIGLMASINFINLALAAHTRRQKEVALRKTMGATQTQIAQQFLLESLLMSAFAFVLALAFIELSIPWLRDIFSLGIEKNALYDLTLLGYLSAAALCVGLISAAYPSFYLARLNPATTLKSNKSIETERSIRFRQLLVLIQFVVSGVLLNNAFICNLQTQHLQAYQPGFQTHHILYALHENFATSKTQDIYSLKNHIARLDNVEAVSFAMYGLMTIQGMEGYRRAGTSNDKLIYMGRVNMAASDELKTLNVKLLAGEYFFPEMPQPETSTSDPTQPQKMQNKIYLNPEALTAFGFSSAQAAINQQIELPSTPPNTGMQVFTIAAVTENIHVGRLNEPAKPVIFWPIGTEALPIALMIRYKGSRTDMSDAIKKIWRDALGYEPYISDIEDAIANEYKDENLLAKFIYLFTGVAIFISCLGLYGLAADATARRTKEIGLRKIHGASEFKIVKLLLWQFSRPVLVANLLVWPIGFYVMSRWLEKFVDRINIHWWGPTALVASSLLALCIAWLTVGGHAYFVARNRPVDSLREE